MMWKAGRSAFLFIFLSVLLSIGAAQSNNAEDVDLSDEDSAGSNNVLNVIGAVYEDEVFQGVEDLTKTGASNVILAMLDCTFNDEALTVGECGRFDSDLTANLQSLLDEISSNNRNIIFVSDDNPNAGEPSGSLDVRFENTPDDPTVGQSPQFKVVGEDSRTGISNDVYLYNNGEVNLTFSPEYEDESSLIAEKTCEPDTPRYCNISVNDGDNEFSFLSPGENTLKTMAEDGAGTVVDASVDVNVQLGNPPNEDNLDRFSVEGGFGDSWNPVLNERWEDSIQAEDNERLAFVQDDYDNIVIDTGDSYLYGGAFVQKQSYDQDVDGKKIQVGYRIDVQGDGNDNTNRFGVVTVDEDGNFRNSTIDPERFDTKDEEGVNQNEKTYTLTHDLSSSTDDIRVGVFFNGDATQDGSGDSGNGMRVIIEDIRIIDEQREVSFEKVTPDFSTGNTDLVRGQVTTFNFKVDDSFDQLDLAKINASYSLNRQDPPESQKLMSRVCEAKSPAFCYTKDFEFTPQKIGEHNIIVGIETKTGKYFQEERSYTVHGGEELTFVELDNDEDEVRFKAQDNFGSGDLTGKTFKALRVEQSTEFNNEYTNRCRGDPFRCYVPGYRPQQELSGEFRFRLLTEENGNIINETTIDIGFN